MTTGYRVVNANPERPAVFPSELADTSPLMQNRKPEHEGLDHPFFIPARRFGGDEEMAGSILYLASRAGAYCNGMHLMNDGGRCAVMPSTY
jgi:NAD(P)-dependent dehydrogenase (short-subunit alcohol dehydrogenase family)